MASYGRQREQLAIRLAGRSFIFAHSQRRPEPVSAPGKSSNALNNLMANIDNEMRTIGTVAFKATAGETVEMYIPKIRRELRFRREVRGGRISSSVQSWFRQRAVCG
jgi:hypothetical protein